MGPAAKGAPGGEGDSFTQGKDAQWGAFGRILAPDAVACHLVHRLGWCPRVSAREGEGVLGCTVVRRAALVR